MNRTFSKVLYFPITRIITGTVICFLLLVGVQNFVTKPILESAISSKPIADTIVNYISVAVLLLSYFYLFRIYERRKITELSRANLMKELFGGFILGFAILSLVILILYLSGYYSIMSVSGLSYMLAPFSVLVVAALLEEIVFRLLVYRIFENWLGTYISLFIIAVVFEVPHWFNNNVTFLSVILGLIFGFAHGIMYTYTKRLWLPLGFHLGWNFAQPFYGSNLSGLDDIGSIIKAKFSGPTLLTGTVYGIEDSIFSIVLLAMVSVLFLYFSIKKNRIIKDKTV
ncbi:MAG: CPBP family intramembrane glutamic endopeptidase [Chitinophagaceae bacterium]